ncbi:unnamed protein product [Caenorhabditis auriculariae]|uniref:PDZ domain-containing protein n=1 Tax=Caenorhabditis auriculariae TaxID=2777116 RepID=A0A8S1HRS9_9PELO|nr:unnamed protein product [Caenorhabditis auriculariae]
MKKFKGKDPLIRNCPESVKHRPVELKIRISESDSKKPPDQVMKVDEEMVVNFLSVGSFYCGIILGDRLLKVNSVPVGVKDRAKAIATITKGEEVIIEVWRRDFTSPPTYERLKNLGMPLRLNHAYFVVNMFKPKQMGTISTIGFTMKNVKRRLMITEILPGSLSSLFLALGDAIVDVDGKSVPFTTNGENDLKYMRSLISRILQTGQASLLIERPVSDETIRDFRRWLNSFERNNSDFDVSPEVINIGLSAANMHGLIFRKVTPKSILSSDVKGRTNGTQEEKSKFIKISGSMLETRISSDVEDEDDLKDVVRKSHAAGSSYDDD